MDRRRTFRVAWVAAMLASGLVDAENAGPPGRSVPESAEFVAAREKMVKDQIEARGVKDAKVLAAMRKVPRHELVPRVYRSGAYADTPLPIGEDQTISQPYIVAFMTEQLALKGTEKVLEIGTGSGYQAAVLAEICKEVYTIEIIEALAKRAREDLQRIGYKGVQVRCGDGYRGWPEQAPFDAIIVTAAPDHVPQPLVEQLKVGGRLILPVGDDYQELIRVTRTEGGVRTERLLGVRFVPMTGEAQKKADGPGDGGQPPRRTSPTTDEGRPKSPANK